MGDKRASSPSVPWQVQPASFQSIPLVSRCRMICLLVLASFPSLCILRVMMTESVSESTGVGLLDGVGHAINLESEGTNNYDSEIYLAAVILTRVFHEDKFNITAYECLQWIEYMLFAGVQHIYWYDAAHIDAESQAPYLQKYVEKGLLTYQRFHHLYPGYYFEHWEQSYEHFLPKYGGGVTWAVDVDVDEYPFMLHDTKRSFLRRYVEDLVKSNPNVTQILMASMLFIGNPKGDLENGWVIERYQRRKQSAETVRAGLAWRQKPIFQPKHAQQGMNPGVPHQLNMKSGDTLVAEHQNLRVNHYWGPRFSDFRPDTADVLALMVPDSAAQPIADELKASTGLTNKIACLQQRRAIVVRDHI